MKHDFEVEKIVENSIEKLILKLSQPEEPGTFLMEFEPVDSFGLDVNVREDGEWKDFLTDTRYKNVEKSLDYILDQLDEKPIVFTQKF